MLFDVKSVLPVQGRRALPAALRLMCPHVDDAVRVVGRRRAELRHRRRSGKFAAVIAAPGAPRPGVQPYQEEPRDVPVSFAFDAARYEPSRQLPACRHGQHRGTAAGACSGRARHGRGASLYAATVDHYRELLASTVEIETPDARLNRGVHVGQGRHRPRGSRQTRRSARACWRIPHVRGQRRPDSPVLRRDALWTALATTAYAGSKRHGPHSSSLRASSARMQDPARDLAKRDVRAMVHGISLRVASADATPLFVIAHRRLLAGDRRSRVPRRELARDRQGVHVSRATDRRRERPHREHERRPRLGRGGGTLPGHEELYLQGLWIEAQRGLAALARVRATRTRGTGRGRRRTGTDRPPIHLLAATGPALRIRHAPRPPPRRGGRTGSPANARSGSLDALAPRGSSRRTPCCLRCALVATLDPARAQLQIITWASRAWQPTGARGC